MIEEQLVQLPLGIEFVFPRDLEPLPPSSPFIEMLKPLRPLGIAALKLQLEITKLEIRARELMSLASELQSTSFQEQFITCQETLKQLEIQYQQGTQMIAEIEQIVRDFLAILNFDSFSEREQHLPLPTSLQQRIKIVQDETQKIRGLIDAYQETLPN